MSSALMVQAVLVASMLFAAALPASGQDQVSVTAYDLAPLEMKAAPELKRPAALPALYLSFAALQGLDGYTTFGGIVRGTREVNPVLSHGKPAVFWTVKAASTASTILLVERLWKRHRVAAVVLMVAVNSGYAAMTVHNARLSR